MHSTITIMAEACTRLLQLLPTHPDLKSAHSKLEKMLVAAIQNTPKAVTDTETRAVVNTGSLKAVKALPKDANLGRNAYGSYVLDADFILRQPKAFLLAVKARGMTISEPTYRKMFETLATSEGSFTIEQTKLLFATFEPDAGLTDHLISKALNADARTSANVGPMIAQALTSIAKRHPEHLQRNFARMCGIFDPAAAHPLFYRKMAIHALLGVTMPAKDTFIHPDMQALAKAITGRAGKQQAMDACTDLPTFLAGGHLAPKGIFKTYEDKRRTWRR